MSYISKKNLKYIRSQWNLKFTKEEINSFIESQVEYYITQACLITIYRKSRTLFLKDILPVSPFKQYNLYTHSFNPFKISNIDKLIHRLCFPYMVSQEISEYVCFMLLFLIHTSGSSDPSSVRGIPSLLRRSTLILGLASISLERYILNICGYINSCRDIILAHSFLTNSLTVEKKQTLHISLSSDVLAYLNLFINNIGKVICSKISILMSDSVHRPSRRNIQPGYTKALPSYTPSGKQTIQCKEIYTAFLLLFFEVNTSFSKEHTHQLTYLLSPSESTKGQQETKCGISKPSSLRSSGFSLSEVNEPVGVRCEVNEPVKVKCESTKKINITSFFPSRRCCRLLREVSGRVSKKASKSFSLILERIIFSLLQYQKGRVNPLDMIETLSKPEWRGLSNYL